MRISTIGGDSDIKAEELTHVFHRIVQKVEDDIGELHFVYHYVRTYDGKVEASMPCRISTLILKVLTTLIRIGVHRISAPPKLRNSGRPLVHENAALRLFGDDYKDVREYWRFGARSRRFEHLPDKR